MTVLIIRSNSQSLPGYRDQIQEKHIFLAHSSCISSCMPATISILAICQKGITVHTAVNLFIIWDFPHTLSNTCTESFPASRFTAYCILKDRRSHFLLPSIEFILHIIERYISPRHLWITIRFLHWFSSSQFLHNNWAVCFLLVANNTFGYIH